MFYSFTNKQTIKQWLFNTFDPRLWFHDRTYTCSWDYMGKSLLWIAEGGCPKHD